MRTLGIAVATGAIDDTYDALESAHEKVQGLIGELGVEEDQDEDLEYQLCILEYDLGQQEDELFASLQKMFTQSLHELQYNGETETRTSTVIPDEAGSDENIPPLLLEYYDKVGDVTVMRERLEDHEAEHQRELAGYEARLAAGGVISKSDEAFLLDYEHDRQAMLRDLSEAQRIATELRQQCLDEGLNPDEDESGEPISKDWLLVDKDDLQKTRQPGLFQQPYHGSSVGHLITGFNGTRDRINRWLMDMLRTSGLEVLKHQNIIEDLHPEAAKNSIWANQPSQPLQMVHSAQLWQHTSSTYLA
ncbi:hypothetical protein B0A49_10546 [Cryomyces minteri]|uniref:Uncharacterized protein n=1 Tax=Cryomyces minteri TaxID=331657 RepID=A0A4U0WR75_9PEZI|nr:hypothetical protein B0A49_10546 [Cryomyces minteri]